jgi:cyclin D1/2/4, plant
VKRHLLDVKTIERTEIFVLGSVNWRTNAVTPFSYISHFADKFNEGYPTNVFLAAPSSYLAL